MLTSHTGMPSGAQLGEGKAPEDHRLHSGKMVTLQEAMQCSNKRCCCSCPPIGSPGTAKVSGVVNQPTRCSRPIHKLRKKTDLFLRGKRGCVCGLWQCPKRRHATLYPGSRAKVSIALFCLWQASRYPFRKTCLNIRLHQLQQTVWVIQRGTPALCMQ